MNCFVLLCHTTTGRLVLPVVLGTRMYQLATIGIPTRRELRHHFRLGQKPLPSNREQGSNLNGLMNLVIIRHESKK